MEALYYEQILTGLHTARWRTAANTFGNDHATLIGLLVDWWISGNPETRTVLEGGPSCEGWGKGEGGQCDALLCENETARAVLEVEGTRIKHTLDKIASFLAATDGMLATLQFAILLIYAYGPVGQGPNRTIPSAVDDNALQKVAELSARFPNKGLILITLDKDYNRQLAGPRRRNEYYWGTPSRIEGTLYRAGSTVALQTYFDLGDLRSASQGHESRQSPDSLPLESS